MTVTVLIFAYKMYFFFKSRDPDLRIPGFETKNKPGARDLDPGTGSSICEPGAGELKISFSLKWL